MGWYYSHDSRRELIEHLTSDRRFRWRLPRGGDSGKECVCERHCCRGNVLWTLWNTPSGYVIGCDLMARDNGLWGYKPMDERMGPFYYTCPMAYLEIAPVANEEWRKGVIEYHNRSNEWKALHR